MFFAPMSGLMSLVLLMGLGGGAGLPLGIPPLPEDPVLAQAAPAECLFYATWSGTAAPDPKSTNQVEQMLAEPEVQQLISEIERRIKEGVREAAKREGPETEALAADATDWVKLLLTRPTAVFVSSVRINVLSAVKGKLGGPPPAPDVRGGLIVNLGEQSARVKAAMLKHQKMLLRGAATLDEVKIGGEVFYRIQLAEEAPPITWGVKGPYFIAGLGKGGAEGIVDRMEAAQVPAWLAAARKQLPVPRRSSLCYVNVRAIIDTFAPLGGPEVQTTLEALGLGNVRSLSSVSGLDQTRFVSKTLVAIDGPPQGIFALATAKPLAAGDLAPIPADATFALAFRLDPDKLFETIRTIVGRIDRRRGEQMEQGMAEAERQLGISFPDDLLRPLGDTWCVYNSPGEGGLIFTGLTAVVQVKDAQRLAKTHEKLLALAKAAMAPEEDRPAKTRDKVKTEKKASAPRKAEDNGPAAPKAALSEEEEEEMPAIRRALPPRRRRGPSGPQIGQFQFAGKEVYFLKAVESGFPFAPAWCLTDKELIFALFPQNIKAYLSRDAKSPSLAKVPEVAEVFQSGGGPLKMFYCDTPKLFELFYPFVPMMAQAISGELQREGINVDVSIIPSAKAIAPHLRPGVMAVRRTEAGIEIISHDSLPGGGMMLGAPMVLPWLLLARAGGESRATFEDRAIVRPLEELPEDVKPSPIRGKSDYAPRKTAPKKAESAPAPKRVPASSRE